MFNLSNAVVQKKRFERENSERSQNFQLKFRISKEKMSFVLNTALFESLGFSQDKAGVIIPSYEDEKQEKVAGVAIAVVDESTGLGTIYNRRGDSKKNPTFTNQFLVAYLENQGILDTSKEGQNQLYNLEKYETEVASVDDTNENYMKPVKKGIPLYIIVPSEESEGDEAVHNEETVEDYE